MRYATGLAAIITLLTACSANPSTPSLGGSSDLNKLFAMTNPRHQGLPATQHPLTHSWMRKAPKGTTGTIWATDLEYATVDVIAYPSGTLFGQVTGFSYPYGVCSDKDGNVYVADFSNETGYEIEAGTTSIINSWPTGGQAIGCSVSNSGDVSFTNFYPGSIIVFPGGGPTSTTYSGPGYDWPAGYDPHGNLFVTCNYEAPCSSPRLAELPAGGSSWNFLNMHPPLQIPGAIQNMGKYLGIANQRIELVKVSGSDAYLVKTIVLNGAGCSTYMDVSGSWGSISKQPNGVVTKKVRYIIAPNLWCFPTPIEIYKATGGDPIGSIIVLTYQYDYGVTFTKP